MNTKNINKYLILYLSLSFGMSWGVGIAFVLFSDILVPIVGELTLTHPIAIIALYSPSIAGLFTYYRLDGARGVKNILSKLIPRKQDLIWIPIILGIFILFATTLHFGSPLFNIPLPEITRTVPQMIAKALWNFIAETGLIGGVFGWIGFLLPFLQRKFKNNITSGLLTGLLFGLWVLPGYLISSFGTSTDYILYVIQLMFFVLFQSYIFNATKGSLFPFLLSFWLAATGSQIELYFFNAQVQLMQITYFIVASVLIHYIFKKFKVEAPLQLFPDFVQDSSLMRQAKTPKLKTSVPLG